MAVSSDLKFVLLEMLPTPELMAQGRELGIQNHLEMVHDCIWALNAVILGAQMRALKEPEVEEWVNDVRIAVADVEDLLRSILGWQPGASNVLPCSFPDVDRVASRHAILLELEEKARRLNYLVRRGSSLCLRKETMDSTYPRREEEEEEREYFTILREEVVGRDEDVEKIIHKIRRKQRQRSHNVHDDDGDDDDGDDDDDGGGGGGDDVDDDGGDCDDDDGGDGDDDDDDDGGGDDDDDDDGGGGDDDDDDDDDDGLWYLVLIGWLMVGKTSIARMVYHHPWVCQHFGRRVWIDGSKLSSFDATWVIKEFMRSIAGEPYEDVWLFYDRFGGSHRYFLILDHFLIGVDDQDELDRLEHFLLLMGEPGSLVMLILDADFADFSYLESRHSFSIHKIVPIKEDNWVKLLMRHALSHPDQVGVEEERMLVSFVDRLDHYFRSSPVYANVLGSIFRYTETSRWQEEIDAVCRTEPIEHNQHFNLMLLHYLSPISARQCLYQLLIPQDYIYGHADLLHVLATEGIPRKEQTKKTTSITLMNRDSTPVLFRLMVGRDSTIPQQCFSLMLLQYLSPIFAPSYLFRLFVSQAYMSRHAGLLHVLASEGIPRKEWRETQLINNALERCYFRMRVGRESTIPQQCLHLHLLVDSRASAFPTTLSAKVNNKLRTLYLRREEEMVLKQQQCQITDIPATMFENLTRLRILHLGATRMQQLPHTVGKLLNLSYLNLSMSEIQVLPASLCNLRNLRVLNLTWCKKLWRLPGRIHNLRSLSIMKLAFCARLQRLPKSVISLANLQELDLEGCHSLIELPKDFHNLRKLTNLSMIKCHSLTRMPNELEQMHNLRMLFGYSINTNGSIEDVISKLQPLVSLEELDLWDLQVISNLKDASTPPMLLRYILPKLKRLALHWEWHNMNDIEITSNNVIWLHVLERLQPTIFLTRLEITSYAGKEFPRWIKDVVRYLYNLKEIRLVNLRRCESLPPLGRLVNLKIVEISGMDSITIVDETFRRLDKLIISEMPRLEKWAELRSPQNRRPATSRMLQWAIEELTLMQCPKLKQFELSYQRVSKLNVWLNNEMLWHCQSGGWQSLIKGIDELTIVGCQELRCLPPVLQSSREVSQLTIIRCNKLISLPDWLAEIGSLKSLFISGCTELTYIPPQLKTRSHLLLQLRGCPKLRF